MNNRLKRIFAIFILIGVMSVGLFSFADEPSEQSEISSAQESKEIPESTVETEPVPDEPEPEGFSFSVSEETLTVSGEGHLVMDGSKFDWEERYGKISVLAIGDGITSIGENAFLNLKAYLVSIPSTVTEIGQHAIGYRQEEDSFTRIESVMIVSDDGTEAHRYAIENGFDFSVPEPDTPHGSFDGIEWEVTTNGILIISGSGKLGDFADGADTPWAKYYSQESEYPIVSVKIGEGITSVGTYAFSADNLISSFEISDSVTEIGANAFAGCSELENIVLGLVRLIGDNAFYGLKKLDTVTVPKLAQLGEGCFAESSLKKISLSQEVTEIPKSAFENCIALNSFSAPAVTSIGERAFLGCKSLTSFQFGGSITEIGASAFAESGLTSVNFNTSMSYLPEKIFFGCESLTSVELNDLVASIGFCSLDNCPLLDSVRFNQNTKDIADSSIGFRIVSESEEGIIYGKYDEQALCFYAPEPSVGMKYALDNEFGFSSTGAVQQDGGTAGENIKWTYRASSESLSFSGTGDMPDYENTEDTPWFIYKDYVKSVSISGVSSVSQSLCEGFSKLNSASIANTVLRIGAYAFAGTPLENVSVPSKLEEIGDSAFDGCINLQAISFPNSIKSIGINAYRGVAVTSVYIPEDVEFIGSSAVGYSMSGNVIEGFLIKGVNGSIAQNYAIENGIKFRVDGYMTITDTDSGANINIIGSDADNYTFSFERKAETLEPLLFLAQGEYVLVYQPLLTSNGASVIIDGDATVTVPMPSDVNHLLVRLYSMDSTKTIEPLTCEISNGKFIYKTNNLDTIIFSNADLSDLYTIEVRCCYDTGELIIDDRVYYATNRAEYKISAPSFDGYTPNIASASGIINGQNVAELFIYSKNVETNAVTQPPETKPNEGEEKKKIDPLILIEIVLIVVLILALILLLVISYRRHVVREIMENADKRKPTVADKLGETQVFSEFSDELDIEALFREAEKDAAIAAAVAEKIEKKGSASVSKQTVLKYFGKRKGTARRTIHKKY